MAANAWRYGWLMSYPKGKRKFTCYSYEPWHYRYVGRELARDIHDSGLTPREYLWANFTQVDLPGGEPAPSPSDAPPPSSPGPIATAATTLPPAGPPTAAPPSSGVAGLVADVPVLAGLLVALGAVVLLTIALWRRPRRR